MNTAEAIYLPINHGAWIMLRVRPRVTLLIYQVTTVVGGLIPDSIVLSVALSKLDELLYGVSECISKMRAHYRVHEPFPGGDGLPMSHDLGY